MDSFPPEVLEHIYSFLPSHQDLENVSLVCKSWYKLERSCRTKLTIPNCYALSHERLIGRFSRLKSFTLKGRPHLDDPNLFPKNWGAFAYPWIEALSRSCYGLEEIKLKRMNVTDGSLVLMSHAFVKLRSLVLVKCDGFSTFGLSAIAANCRFLQVLDLQGNEVVEGPYNWLGCFPENFTSLVCLNFACVEGAIDLVALERLVVRCPNLSSLRLSRAVPFDMLQKILVQVPQLLDLGIGSYIHVADSRSYKKLSDAVQHCLLIRSLSGFLAVDVLCMPAIYPICSNLTSLDLINATETVGSSLVGMLRKCKNLQCLRVLQSVGNQVLQVVSATCKDLQELKVVHSESSRHAIMNVTEQGLEAVSKGCPKLNTLLYNCRRMTNAALIAVAENCPDITRFTLHSRQPKAPDHITSRPFDEGIGAVVHSCKNLKNLSLSVCLSDQVFLDISMYAEQLEMLSITFCGESDTGILYALSGCKRLKKLVVRNSPLGDATLQAAAGRYEALQFLWVSSCEVSLRGCKALARKVPMLNVEIINDKDRMEEDDKDVMNVDEMYLYRSLDGPRADTPEVIRSL